MLFRSEFERRRGHFRYCFRPLLLVSFLFLFPCRWAVCMCVRRRESDDWNKYFGVGEGGNFLVESDNIRDGVAAAAAAAGLSISEPSGVRVENW